MKKGLDAATEDGPIFSRDEAMTILPCCVKLNLRTCQLECY
jgi:hypothetical protein